MLIVYTGNGKGKTSASVGQAVRAKGQNLTVRFAQFLKHDKIAGEQIILQSVLDKNAFFAGGCGFYTNEREKEAQRAAATEVISWAEEQVGSAQLLVLDEALYALGLDLITKEQLQHIINQCEVAGCHLVLSGRGLPDWLREVADTVSEIQEVKHAYQKGIKAQAGIEF